MMPETILPTAANMVEINNAIIILIIVIVTGLGTTAATLFTTFKWYLPATFKRRDEQRELELENLRKELDSKHAAEAVEIERERLLPQLVEQNRIMSNTTITLAQSFNTTIQQKTEQDAALTAAWNAHTKQLTTNTDRLEDLARDVGEAIAEIGKITASSSATQVNSAAAAVAANAAATAAQATLVLMQSRLGQVIESVKHDSRPIPIIDAPVSDSGEDLKPTGTG